MDIVERLRFDAVRCETQFSKGVATNIEDAIAEIERLRAALNPFAEAYLLSQKYSREHREGYLANAMTYAEFEAASAALAYHQSTSSATAPVGEEKR